MATARSSSKRKWKWTPARRAAFKRMTEGRLRKQSGRSRRDLIERGGKVRRSPSRKPLYAGRRALTEFAAADARKVAKRHGRKKARTPAQIAATERMLEARRAKLARKAERSSARKSRKRVATRSGAGHLPTLYKRGGRIVQSHKSAPLFTGRSALTAAALGDVYGRVDRRDVTERAAASTWADRAVARARAEAKAEREAEQAAAERHRREFPTTVIGLANKVNARLRNEGSLGHMGGGYDDGEDRHSVVFPHEQRVERENRGRKGHKHGRKGRRYYGF